MGKPKSEPDDAARGRMLIDSTLRTLDADIQRARHRDMDDRQREDAGGDRQRDNQREQGSKRPALPPAAGIVENRGLHITCYPALTQKRKRRPAGSG